MTTMTLTNFNESYILYWNNVTVNFIVLICLPFIVFAGIIGNGLTFVIMMRKAMRKKGFCFYLATLAISDTIHLCNYGTWYVVYAASRSAVDISVFAQCKLDYFVDAVVHQYSGWVLMVVALERFISVYFPLKTKTLLTLHNAKIVCCALITSICLTSLPNLLPESRQVVQWGPFYACEPVKDRSLSYFLTDVWPMLDVAMYGIIPGSAMIILNILIVYKIKRINPIGELNSSRPKHFNQLTRTLLVVSTTYVILVLPYGFYVFYIEQDYHNNKYIYTSNPLFAFFVVGNFLNSSINFILYCLSGERFRTEFFKIFPCATQTSVSTRNDTITHSATSSITAISASIM